jgi:amino acid adenylation domain-containing protein/non-ribosomal peptide synthase protein (TIGR01720 family)
VSGKSNIEAIYRLAPLQEGILYHTLQNPDRDVYLVQYQCTLEGLEDATRWRQAWQLCSERHSILRTLFTWEKREHPLQLVRGSVDLPWETLDWRECDGAEQQRRLDALLAADREQPFDLERAPLMRFTLVDAGRGRHFFLWTFHHILLDGWSVCLLLDEALAHCRKEPGAERRGQEQDRHDYHRFIKWLERRDLAAERDFWTRRLGDYRQPCLLQSALPVADAQQRPGTGRAALTLDADLSGRLSRRAAVHRVTLNTLLVAAWALVLRANCRREDVVFGTTVAGRPAGLEGAGEIAGLFINTLPMRLTVPASGSLAQWLREVQAARLEMQVYENSALTEVQRCSGVEPGSALFDSIMVFENLRGEAGVSPTKSAPRIVDAQFREFSHYPLAILVEPGERLSLSAVYRSGQLGVDAAQGLLRQLAAILRQFAGDVELSVEDIAPLPPADRRRMEVDWNATPPPDTSGRCIHQWFEEVARDHPGRVAVVDGDDTLSFAQLDAQANRLAWHLIARGVEPQSRVVVLMPRSADAIIGFLAVLKAGAVYIPLDADIPPARASAIWQELESRQSLLLTRSGLADGLTRNGRDSLCIDLEREQIAQQPAHNPALSVSPAELAYVIYTSGSTGAPKGVMIEHGALVSSTRARLQYYPQQPDSFLLLSSLAVDSSVAGIYWCLCSGATLVIAGHRLEQDMERMTQLIERRQISHLLCIPTLYQLLLDHGGLDQLRSLQTVIVAGEACAPGIIERHRASMPGASLYNEYGPSECTVWATAADLASWRPGDPVPIGRPIPGTLAYILDERQRSVLPGAAGELYLGGAGLARGYLDDPALSASAFPLVTGVERPDGWSDQRLYRTGDRARYLPDGQIEFLGRMDNQIKVRGYRVEPEEIEATLCSHPAVQAAAVFLQPTAVQVSDRVAAKLHGCVVLTSGSDVSAEALRNYVGDQLPGHMVPQTLRVVLELPRGPTGKLDRRALASYNWQFAQETSGDTTPASEPRKVNATEQILLDIWREVLDVEDIDTHSNFFELGGDSLLSIRVLSRARKAGLELSSDEFFEQPTVAGQALLAGSTVDKATTAPADTGALLLSPIQGWFFRHIDSYREQWNQSLLLCVDRSIDGDTLERALAQLVRRHEALRMVFEQVDGEWRPRLLPDLPRPMLRRLALPQLDETELLRALEDAAAASCRHFDLGRGPLLAGTLVKTAPDLDDRLLLCAHHLLVDAQSWRILVQELAALCEGAQLAPVEYSYSRWLAQLRAYAVSDELAAQRVYWESIVSAPSGPLPLEPARAKQGNCNGSERQLLVRLPPDTTACLLRELPIKYSCDLSDALLAGLLRSLVEWAQVEQLHIDVEGHGRERLLPGMDPGQTVGWLTSVHTQLLRRVVGEDATATLLRVKDSLRTTPNRGVGCGVLRHLTQAGREGPLAARGPAQVCFNYLGRLDLLAEDDGLLRVERENLGEMRAAAGPRAYLLEINCWLSDGQVTIAIAYSDALHEQATIAGLADNYLAQLREIAEACNETAHKVWSASDFPLANLDQAGLAQIGRLLGDD